MHPAGHLLASTLAALTLSRRRRAFPWLLWGGSLVSDLDHLVWHAANSDRLDPVGAWRYFRSDPSDGPQQHLPLHRYEVIGLGLLVGHWCHPLREVALGLALHRLVDDATDLWHSGRRRSVQRRRERLRAIVFARERHVCQGCGATGLPLELHHRIPEAEGGPNTPSNLLALCRTCHDRAHGRSQR